MDSLQIIAYYHKPNFSSAASQTEVNIHRNVLTEYKNIAT